MQSNRTERRNIIIIRDLKTPLSAIDKISTEKNSQVCRTEHYLKPTGSNDIYKILHLTRAAYTLLSNCTRNIPQDRS